MRTAAGCWWFFPFVMDGFAGVSLDLQTLISRLHVIWYAIELYWLNFEFAVWWFCYRFTYCQQQFVLHFSGEKKSKTPSHNIMLFSFWGFLFEERIYNDNSIILQYTFVLYRLISQLVMISPGNRGKLLF